LQEVYVGIEVQDAKLPNEKAIALFPLPWKKRDRSFDSNVPKLG
jgi:hypothetical protein